MKWNLPVTDRFLNHIRKTETCWIWRGGDKFRISKNPSRADKPKRFAYKTWVGPIPDKKQIVNNCGNRKCVRPEHLICKLPLIRQQLIARKRRRKRDVAQKYKIGKACNHCGIADHRVLDYHHRDPSTKKFALSNPGGRSCKTIELEIKKCDLLCANCHRIHHYNEIEKNFQNSISNPTTLDAP